MWDWLVKNKNWVFDGWGVAIPIFILSLLISLVIYLWKKWKNGHSTPSERHRQASKYNVKQGNINVNVSPIFNTTSQPESTAIKQPHTPPKDLSLPVQKVLLPQIAYCESRAIYLPINFNNNNFDNEQFNPQLIGDDQEVVQVVLAKFYYKPEPNTLPWITVKPHIFFKGKRSVYDAVWYREEDEHKQVVAGKAYELVVGLLPLHRNDAFWTYEYDRKRRDNTIGRYDFFEPNTVEMNGNYFEVIIELVCKQHGHVITTVRSEFTLSLDPTPRLELVNSDKSNSQI